jgi:hypothetical protein
LRRFCMGSALVTTSEGGSLRHAVASHRRKVVLRVGRRPLPGVSLHVGRDAEGLGRVRPARHLSARSADYDTGIDLLDSPDGALRSLLVTSGWRWP